MTKSLEDYRIMLERVDGCQVDLGIKARMGRQRTTACKNSLKLAEQALERVRKQETAENGLKILENGRDKHVNMAEATYTH